MRIIILISLLALFSCQKQKVCKCHRELWRYQFNQGWIMVYKDSTNTYLDFCANDSLVQLDIDNTKDLIICE